MIENGRKIINRTQIGMLTSSIMTYFVREENNDKNDQLDQIMKKLTDIEKQNYELKKELEELKQK